MPIATFDPTAVVFRIYTETADNLITLTARYFSGATFYDCIGLWNSDTEPATVIEIVGTVADLQQVIDLAGDIREVNRQSSVLVTKHRVDTLVLGD